MTPAIQLAKKCALDYQVHEYTHDSHAASFGLEAADKLGVDAAQVFKTLVVATDTGALAVAILPVNQTLSLKKMAKALSFNKKPSSKGPSDKQSANKLLSCKKCQMADPKQVERSTGYVLGGVSPLGQKKRLPTIIDSSAQTQPSIYVSGGRRGLEIELPPEQLAHVLDAPFGSIADE